MTSRTASRIAKLLMALAEQRACPTRLIPDGAIARLVFEWCRAQSCPTTPEQRIDMLRFARLLASDKTLLQATLGRKE